MKTIVLASASPRRREILKNLGLSFEVLSADVDETSDERDPARLCELLAARKGEAAVSRLAREARDLSGLLVIASDTVVAVDAPAASVGSARAAAGKEPDKEPSAAGLSSVSGLSFSEKTADFDYTVCKNSSFEILGKPADAADARRMLRLLSGRPHRVVSGVYLWMNGVSAVSHDVTEVVFDRLSDDEIDRYIASGEPFGKAGAYAVQGLASSFVSGIRGDYFNVVGLPVHRMCALFRETFPNEPPLV